MGAEKGFVGTVPCVEAAGGRAEKGLVSTAAEGGLSAPPADAPVKDASAEPAPGEARRVDVAEGVASGAVSEEAPPAKPPPPPPPPPPMPEASAQPGKARLPLLLPSISASSLELCSTMRKGAAEVGEGRAVVVVVVLGL